MPQLKQIEVNGTTYDITVDSSTQEATIPAENVKETVVDADVDYKSQDVWTSGVYLNTNGTEGTNVLFSVSDYIPVEDTDTVKILTKTANFSLGLGCYDASKSWISRKESGYTSANVELAVTLPQNTAFVRINLNSGMLTNTNVEYIKVPTTYTLRDWQDTVKNRMNQLAVRTDIYNKLDDITGRLLWNLTKWQGKTLVVDGNSLVEAVNWGTHTAQLLGMNFVNLGASGSNLVHGQTTMAGIKNLVANSFPNEADLILLQGDSNTQVADSVNPADQMDGENATNSWSARINYLVRCLKAKYPNCVIVFMPDSVRYERKLSTGLYGQNPASPNIVYPNQNIYEGMKKIAEYNRHHFWMIDGDTPFNPTNYYNEYVQKTAVSGFTENDGTHPAGYFAEAKGKAVAWWIGGLTYDPRADNHAVSGWQDLVTATITATYGSGVTHTSNATDIQYYLYYENTLSGESSVTVTMGGVDVTSSVYDSSTHKIFISRVTGNLIITAN